MIARLWKDNPFQFGVCLLILALGCTAFLLFSQPERSSLVTISGHIEGVKRTVGANHRGLTSAKLILFVRTSSGLVKVNAEPWVDPDRTLAYGQRVKALVSYEDALGRDIAFLYELTRGPDALLTYNRKIEVDRARISFVAGLAPYLATAGLLLCAFRWKKLT